MERLLLQDFVGVTDLAGFLMWRNRPSGET